MTATSLPGESGIPPFAIYRSTVAAWEDGSIKLLYIRLKGQGAKVLVEELPGEEPVELGNKYQLVLERIEEAAPVPPIDMPTFPVLPEPPIEMLPPDYQKPEHPVYEKPGYPDYQKPEHPIYDKPEKPEKPIYKPGDNPDAPDRPQPGK
jgi:hypothetical protein